MPPLHPGEPGDGHGEDDHDDVGYVPPLPPEDRLWRHPSEVASARAVAAPAPAGRTDRRTAALMLVSGMVGATLAVGAVALSGGFEQRIVERQVAVASADGGEDGGSPAQTAASVAARTAPSVAGLRIERGDEEGLASAVAFRSNGYLLTDGPSVVDADGIQVLLADGRSSTARVVGVDHVTGIAVLHVDGDLEPAALAEGAGTLHVGEPTVAVGASLEDGWEATVSAGVVSAVDRRLVGHGGTTRHGMILVDAPFGPGAAGGALLDGAGAVVGIVSSGHADAGGTTFGVATPIDMVDHVADQIIEDGRARHVWLGLRGSDLDAEEATSLGLPGGAVVDRAEPHGPAHRAGVEPGDVIVSVDDHPIPSMSALIAALRRHAPGDLVALGILRDGETHTVRVTLAEKR